MGGVLTMPSELSKATHPDSASKGRHDTSSHDDLVARAAHELRGSLGAISNWVHLLSQAAKDGALQQQGLAAMQRALQVSTRLVEELADVTLLRSGRLRLRSGLVDLVPIVEMSLERPRATAREKGVRLDVVHEVSSVPVMGDPDRLQQIVLHLVGNAVKFTPAGGRVEVAIGRDGTSWHLTVSDTGPGLSPDVLGRLFGGLRQADFVAPRLPASLGVGLTMVGHLTELHGGSVEASSAGPGQGARFVVRLPVPALVPPKLTGPVTRDEPSAPEGTRARGKRHATKEPHRLMPGN
jgi:two-component system CheB/CheR fusion protein